MTDRLRWFAAVLVVAGCASWSVARGQAIAGVGYDYLDLAREGILVSPGLVLTIRVAGLPDSFSLPKAYVAEGTPPLAMAGVTVRMSDTFFGRSRALPILALEIIRQFINSSPTEAGGSRVLFATVQIPFDTRLDPSSSFASFIDPGTHRLHVELDGQPTSVVQIFVQSSTPRIATTCDLPGLRLSGCILLAKRADGLPLAIEPPSSAGATVPPGEMITARAYGLGLPESGAETGSPFSSDSAAQEVMADAEWITRNGRIRGGAMKPVYSGTFPGEGVGVYRITWQVPEPPEGVSPCQPGPVQTNLVVRLPRKRFWATRPLPDDEFRICVRVPPVNGDAPAPQ